MRPFEAIKPKYSLHVYIPTFTPQHGMNSIVASPWTVVCNLFYHACACACLLDDGYRQLNTTPYQKTSMSCTRGQSPLRTSFAYISPARAGAKFFRSFLMTFSKMLFYRVRWATSRLSPRLLASSCLSHCTSLVPSSP